MAPKPKAASASKRSKDASVELPEAASLTSRVRTAAPVVQHTQLFIANRFVDAVGGGTLETINPVTEQVICKVACAGKADVDLAEQAASKGFELGAEGGTMDAAGRGGLVYRVAEPLGVSFKPLTLPPIYPV